MDTSSKNNNLKFPRTSYSKHQRTFVTNKKSPRKLVLDFADFKPVANIERSCFNKTNNAMQSTTSTSNNITNNLIDENINISSTTSDELFDDSTELFEVEPRCKSPSIIRGARLPPQPSPKKHKHPIMVTNKTSSTKSVYMKSAPVNLDSNLKKNLFVDDKYVEDDSKNVLSPSVIRNCPSSRNKTNEIANVLPQDKYAANEDSIVIDEHTPNLNLKKYSYLGETMQNILCETMNLSPLNNALSDVKSDSKTNTKANNNKSLMINETIDSKKSCPLFDESTNEISKATEDIGKSSSQKRDFEDISWNESWLFDLKKCKKAKMSDYENRRDDVTIELVVPLNSESKSPMTRSKSKTIKNSLFEEQQTSTPISLYIKKDIYIIYYKI